ncbi:t-SNARE [Neocallimastix lanati (nom. inval.)]|nr:t-SNARE [Neocallimastix sp. JGI-2020a]
MLKYYFKKGSSVAPDQSATDSSNKNSADINDYLSKIEILKTSNAVIKQKVENLEQLYNRSLDTINDTQLKQISEELNNEMDTIAKNSKDIQLQLIAIDKENKKLSSQLQPSDLRIRQTQHVSLTKSFMDTMKKYRDIQTKYQEKYKERMEKQYLIVNPNTSESEIARLLESGELGTVFAQQLEKGSKSADAKAALQDIQERHQEIIKIEQTVMELQQLFIDMQVLVKEQGEVINQIENNVQDANKNTEQGVEELKTAVVYQKKARKKLVILILLILIIIIIILVVIFI